MKTAAENFIHLRSIPHRRLGLKFIKSLAKTEWSHCTAGKTMNDIGAALLLH